MARVIAVASAKGGVGKTTTTATLGTTLAAAGARVVAVDADLGMANLGDVLGIEADEATVHDVLAGRADVDAATYEGPAGLAVVPGDTDLAAFPDADPANLREVLGEFIDYDYVLLDTGAGLSHDSVLPLGLADDVLLVTTPDPSAVGDTEKTRQVAERLGGSVAGAVVTRVDLDHLADEDFASALDASLLATVPSSSLVTTATTTGEPVSLADPTSDVAAAYRGLARELTGEAIADPEVEPTEDEAETAEDDEVEAVEDDQVPEDDAPVDTADDSETEIDADEPPTAADADVGDDDPDTVAEDDVGEVVDTDDADDADETVDDSEDDVESEAAAADGDATEGENEVDEDAAAVDAEAGAETGEGDDDAKADSDDATDDTDVDPADTDDATDDTDDAEEAAEDDVLVPDAESGDPAESGGSDESDAEADSDTDDGGVYETSLVEEAEANGASADAAGSDETDDDDDDGRSGFLGRLLG